MNRAAPAARVEPEAPRGPNRQPLRVWLQLYACTAMIETELRRRLREEFNTTLPRFDLLAQLERVENGLTLGALSRRLMVSNGNVTGLVERLVRSGHVTRMPSPEDKRAQIIALTPRGRADFALMAQAHSQWISELLSDLAPDTITSLLAELRQLKSAAKRSLSKERDR